MSRISQDFINSVGYLYEEINIQQNDFLNEESEHYDAEAAELVEDILATISTSMVYEGYSAEGIIGFLADSSEETIIEKYLSFDENILTESVVSEDYIVEQLEIFDTALNEGIGSLIGKAASGVGKLLAKRAPALSKGPGMLTQKAAYRLAMKGQPTLATKAKVGLQRLIGPKGRKAVQAVKDVASKAKSALPGIAKGAGIFGLGAAGGYVGAKMAGAGSGTKSIESQRPPASADAPSAPSAPSSSAPSGGGGGSAPSGGGAKKSKSAAPATSKQTGNKTKDMSTWAKANPRLAQAEKLRSTGASREEINKVLYNKGTAASKASGQSEMEKSAEEIRKMANSSRQRQGSLMGGPEGPGKVDTKAVDTAIEAEKERQKKRLEQQNNTSMTAKESYEPYDIILNYLMSEGHADTLDEANYIMLEMDENAICTIVEEYNDYLLAEEIEEWVNDLVDEGYDLSEYSWDDVVEYYVNEANRAEKELKLSPRKREISRNLRYKNLHVKPSKRRSDSDFYKPENLKPNPKNTYSGDESDSWHDSMSQVRRVRSKVNKN